MRIRTGAINLEVGPHTALVRASGGGRQGSPYAGYTSPVGYYRPMGLRLLALGVLSAAMSFTQHRSKEGPQNRVNAQKENDLTHAKCFRVYYMVPSNTTILSVTEILRQ